MTANAVPTSTVRVSLKRAPTTVSATRRGGRGERGEADGVEVDVAVDLDRVIADDGDEHGRRGRHRGSRA